MIDQQEMRVAVQSVINAAMQDVLRNVLVEKPFNKNNYSAEHPLEAVLVPDEILKSAYFSRLMAESFSETWKLLARTVAEKSLGFGVTGRKIIGTVREGRLRRIAEVLNSLEHSPAGQPKRKPDWNKELEYILQAKGEPIPVTVVCDVYAEDRVRHQRYAFELKAPLPNSDITKVSKEKILKLYSMEPRQIDGAYYALPYNPYGKKENYAWSFPSRWFNMKEDEVVLIGDEFWEKIGGVGTYQSFIAAINEIGPDYRDRIYREFLQIEPPDNADYTTL